MYKWNFYKQSGYDQFFLIDSKLNWKEHIKMMQSKVSKTTAIIYKASYVLNDKVVYVLYCSLVLLCMMHCAEVWDNTLNQRIALIRKAKKLTKIGCRPKRLNHTTPLFIKLHTLKSFDLINLKTDMIMYKAFKNMLGWGVNKLLNIYIGVTLIYIINQLDTSNVLDCFAICTAKLLEMLNACCNSERCVIMMCHKQYDTWKYFSLLNMFDGRRNYKLHYFSFLLSQHCR